MYGNSGQVYEDATLRPTKKLKGEGTSTGFCYGDVETAWATKETCFRLRYCIHEFIQDRSPEIDGS